MDLQKHMELATAVGFEMVSELDLSTISLNPELRAMCSPSGCHSYGKYWTCPPAAPELSELRELYDSYTHGIIMQTIAKREHEFDYEAYTKAGLRNKKQVAELKKRYNTEGIDSLPLSSGTCVICKKCSYPAEPCRHPDIVHKSMSASGMDVGALCKANGLKYNYGNNSICYVACFLFR